MKVKELIERLQKANPEAEIWITFSRDGNQEVITDMFYIEEIYTTAYEHIVEFNAF